MHRHRRAANYAMEQSAGPDLRSLVGGARSTTVITGRLSEISSFGGLLREVIHDRARRTPRGDLKTNVPAHIQRSSAMPKDTVLAEACCIEHRAGIGQPRPRAASPPDVGAGCDRKGGRGREVPARLRGLRCSTTIDQARSTGFKGRLCYAGDRLVEGDRPTIDRRPQHHHDVRRD